MVSVDNGSTFTATWGIELTNTVSNISSTWKHFKQAWSLYEIALDGQDKEENVRVATFLHVAAKDALDQVWKKYSYLHD